MAKKQGRNPRAGRHGIGAPLGSAGTPRAGQGRHVANGVGTGYNVQTASRPAMRPVPPVLTDQARTSLGAQRIIPRPPMPFENPQGPVNVPVQKSQLVNTRKSKENVYYDGGQPVNPLQKAGGYKATQVGCAQTSLSADEMAAVGYGAKDTTSSNPIISGHPTRTRRRG